MSKTIKVGIIGCGAISNAYLNAAKTFEVIDIVAGADINMDVAKAKAEEHNIKAVPVDEILADPEIKIILNLTIPQAHAEINIRALEAGKHAYCEKPFAVTREEGQGVLELAKEKGLMTGCAPDTFLGGGIQTCRKLIDDGVIGKPIAGTAFMMCHGHERWHPNPGFYYLNGGGPMFDMGPYYLTALVNLLGPVKRVSACTAKTFEERTCTCEARYGEILPVEVNTHVAGTMEFVSGAIITIVMSFDVWLHSNKCIELHGTEGSMEVPNPNTFGGPVNVSKPNVVGWQEYVLTHGYSDNMRSIGVADMAYAIQSGRKNRCSGELAYHILDVMHAFDESSESGTHIMIESTCERPEPFPLGLKNGQLDE